MYIADSCGATNANISKSNCLINPSLTNKLLVSPNQNLELSLDILTNKTILTDLIKAGQIFVFPIIKDVRNSTFSGITTATDNSGNTVITSTRESFNIQFGIEIGQCMLNKAVSWNGRKVAVWAVSEANEIEGVQIENTLEAQVLRGLPSLITFGKRPRKVNAGDIVYPTMNWIVDNDVTNYAKPASYDLSLVDGIVDLTFETISSSATAAVIKVTEGCNGTAVLGLDADFEVTNLLGATIVPTSVTDNEDGTYSFVFSTLPASTYSVNFATVTVEVVGSSAIYGKTTEPATFVI
ncbi:MAG: hypothetical protein WD512_11090 [Candidatus Paceibacterota bacterium]